MRRRLFSNLSKGIDTNRYMTILALEDGLTVSVDTFFYYCVDGDGRWKTLANNQFTEPINAGQRLSFKNESTSFSGSIGRFTISKKCNLEGNCNALIYGDYAEDYDTVTYERFAYLFSNNSTIIEVSDDFLPAGDIGGYVYAGMFRNCTSLIKAPKLPATLLLVSCYTSMFDGCTSLLNAPELPATSLPRDCYSYMFEGCTNLNYIKMLATDISASDCLYNWVNGVASTGTFVKHPEATWSVSGNSGVPGGWTILFDGEESEGGVK